MSKIVAALLLIPLAAIPTGVFERSSDVLKCPSRVGGDPNMPASVILLDNEVFEGEPEDLYPWVSRESDKVTRPARERETGAADDYEPLHSLEVVCWRWVEANYEIRVRQGASYTLTKKWVERTRHDRIAALEAVVAAQDRHREQTGAYTADVEDLPGFGALSGYGLPGHLQLDLTRAGDGWTARLVPEEGWSTGPYTRMKPLYDCFAFAGEAPAEWEAMAAEQQAALTERQPVCF